MQYIIFILLLIIPLQTNAQYFNNIIDYQNSNNNSKPIIKKHHFPIKPKKKIYLDAFGHKINNCKGNHFDIQYKKEFYVHHNIKFLECSYCHKQKICGHYTNSNKQEKEK